MRIFLTILILIFSFQFLAKANDIRDFEIEGLSIGDSLLNFASEKKIKSSISNNQYPNDKYTIYMADKLLDLKKYDFLAATVKADV